MQHPIIKGQTFKVTLPVDFDYLTGGQTYLATLRFHGKRTKRAGRLESVRFDRLDESAGTFLRSFQWMQLQAIPGVEIVPAWKEEN